MNYKWESKDDLIALLLFKIGASNEIIERASLEIGCPSGSLKMRIQNLEFLKNGTGRMDHCAKQTEDIYKKFQSLL